MVGWTDCRTLLGCLGACALLSGAPFDPGAIAAGTPPPGQAASDARLAGFERARVRIDAQDGGQHCLDVYLALDRSQRARGLMFVEELAENEGMLFLYPQAQFISMWMKNTPLALDMLFIGVGGYIRQIEHDTEPFSLRSIRSEDAVLGVLELEAGTARRLGLKVGDRLVYESLIEETASAHD